MQLDETDRSILRILQSDARTPFSEIAREIEMSSATVHDRVGRLEDEGIIEGYHTSVDARAVGFGTSAVVGLRIEQGQEDDAVERLREIDGVQEIHLTTGEWDVVLRVYAEDTDHLRELMFDNIARIDGFSRSQTMVILGSELEDRSLPI
ncbi:Lrp/AsnC family transcriptional regulator [Halobellus clavatus]|jgi:Lrp/AsnC family transcriptional regulator for asnA, asnC and gidA|uniref:Lrp/AsnC family transcriptional regulator, regulator for asnA, asnC and gidA n=1 Tax=Halobellus clavatus TaxID=660517 RepID=A0A1H3F3K9_9EURY|nr:Lrp/AsnC family transcriptional regulator [Halobellus clavatus]SDX84774.1 Lrp/AsnC family transcriptional regulator, regulator for asnA, asnC and gidA [Halobellus clavatus]